MQLPPNGSLASLVSFASCFLRSGTSDESAGKSINKHGNAWISFFSSLPQENDEISQNTNADAPDYVIASLSLSLALALPLSL